LLASILTSIGPAYLCIGLPSSTKVSIQSTSHLPFSFFTLFSPPPSSPIFPSHHTALLLLLLLLPLLLLTKSIPVHVALIGKLLPPLELLARSAPLRLRNAEALRAVREVLDPLRHDARALHRPEAERLHLPTAVLGELDVCAGVDRLESDAHCGGGGGMGTVERIEVSFGKG
jgi:hypothetical protein